MDRLLPAELGRSQRQLTSSFRGAPLGANPESSQLLQPLDSGSTRRRVSRNDGKNVGWVEMTEKRKDPASLRSARWFAPDDLRAFGHRSRAMQMGYAPEE